MIKAGDFVKYVKFVEEQNNLHIYDNPTNSLFVGDVYYVEHVELYSNHIQIKLRGINGKFNFLCFEVIKNNEST